MTEKRRHKRIPLEVHLDYIRVKPTYYEVTVSANEIKGITTDISIGGMGLITAEPLAIGNTVFFEFFLPSKKRNL